MDLQCMLLLQTYGRIRKAVIIITGMDSTIIPVTVFNGARDGKTLGITAGDHVKKGMDLAVIALGNR
ncbi:hypothetical protein Dfer_1808 [Dyadobacter fermentans DSM 18053]|uniref:Uncharacterized protein n=1 Tax=Dyadobacter fermentans (strain ATCC 700827 / DSM 18053 / CIP 107007 / KCTC 52180 / NS114) TaxID=471854 RepID=C6VUR0_DYAFD|nr:hypothetical protein Dfer_1808 [Dyadobacter fermentans DSM 18053]